MPRSLCARLLTVAVLCVLTACSGGGSSSVPRPAATATSTASQTPGVTTTTFRLGIPVDANASAHGIKPAFVSPATSGVRIDVYTSPRASNPAAVDSYTYDVSASSNACQTSGTTRTCSIVLPVAPGTYDFVATLYDAAPSSGTFANAKELATGTAAATTILQNTANVVSIAVGGLVSSIALGPVRTVAVNTAATSYGLAVSAFDADGQAISAGAQDPYADPITLSVSDTGGNHTTLSRNGGTPSSSVTISQSSDTIVVAYDGGGAAGYYATVSATASGAAAAATAGFDSFNATLTLVSFVGTTSPQTETVVEPHHTGPAVVTLPPSCANVTTSGPVTDDGSTETFVLSAGTLAGQCYVTASSETSTANVPIKVVNQVPGVVTIPTNRVFAAIGGTSIEAFDLSNGNLVQTISGAATTFGSLNGIARDSAGNIFVSDIGTGQVDKFASNASGNASPLSALTIPGASGEQGLPSGVGLDRPGDVYVSELIGGYTATSLDVFAPGATGAATLVSTSTTSNTACESFEIIYAIAVDPSGRSYTAEACNGVAYVDVFAYGGATPLKTIAMPFAAPANGGLAVDLSGDVYVVDSTDNKFYEFGPTAVGAATPIRVGTGLASPQGIAVNNSGTVYVLTHPTSGSTTTTAIAVYVNGSTTPQATVQIAPTNTSGELAL